MCVNHEASHIAPALAKIKPFWTSWNSCELDYHLVISFGAVVVFLTLIRPCLLNTFSFTATAQWQVHGGLHTDSYLGLPQHHVTVERPGSSVFSKLIVTVPVEGGQSRSHLFPWIRFHKLVHRFEPRAFQSWTHFTQNYPFCHSNLTSVSPGVCITEPAIWPRLMRGQREFPPLSNMTKRTKGQRNVHLLMDSMSVDSSSCRCL